MLSRRSARPAAVVVHACCDGSMVTVDDVRRIARSLPGSYEVVVRDRVKFRVGRYVYIAFSREETIMPPDRVDERYHWVQARMAALDAEQLSELVVDAWRIAAPKRLVADYTA